MALLPVAVATGNCEIRGHSYVREINVDDSGKATGVTYFDKANNNEEVFQKAKCVVLSANGTETPRLLLLSKSNRFPQGLANSSGIVGKYLMTGNGGGASGLFTDPLNEYKGCVTGAAVLSYVPNDVKNRGFYGGGRMTARGQMSPIQYGLVGPAWRAQLGRRLQEGADRAGQPPADHGQLHLPAAGGNQHGGPGSRREGRLGPARHAHHHDQSRE